MAGISDLITGLRVIAGAARVRLTDGVGGDIARTPLDPRSATDQFVPLGGLNDDNWRPARVDRMGSSAVALNNVLFSEPFEGTTLSVPNRISIAATTFTQVQSLSGGLNLNSGNSNAAGAAVLLTTNRRFLKMQRAPLHLKIRARALHVLNSIMEFGFGLQASQTAPPTVGAYFQITTGGVVQGVLTFNGVDQTTAPITLPANWRDNFFTWDVILDDDEALFMVQDTATGLIIAERRIQLQTSQARLWDATRLPAFARLHNVTAPATAPTLILSSMDVVMLDALMNKPWGHTAAGMGLGGEINPVSFAQSANYVNNAVPVSAALSNTAAGYTTLGGQFQFAAVAGAETDYALFGFTVPAPYSFFCTDIDIDVFNMGAANSATVPTLLQWLVSPDQTALSLATGNNRRIPLGTQSIPINAVPGQNGDRPVQGRFGNAPLVTNPGRVFVIGLKVPVGAATASQIIRGVASVKGYFE